MYNIFWPFVRLRGFLCFFFVFFGNVHYCHCSCRQHLMRWWGRTCKPGLVWWNKARPWGGKAVPLNITTGGWLAMGTCDVALILYASRAFGAAWLLSLMKAFTIKHSTYYFFGHRGIRHIAESCLSVCRVPVYLHGSDSFLSMCFSQLC